MATAKQAASNKRNAKKSCGPTSAAGKAKVSQNRLTHGLRGKFQVLEQIENQEDYDQLLDDFVAAQQPADRQELELVVKMAQATWLSARAVRMQETCFVPMPKTPEQQQAGEIPIGLTVSLDTCLRYQAAQDRAYQRAAKELRELRNERLKAEIGFERQKEKEAEQIRKTEKHIVAMATANLKKQRLEMQLAATIADALPPNVDISTLNSLLSTLPSQTEPRPKGPVGRMNNSEPQA